jgi:urea transport system ATP-binding protein
LLVEQHVGFALAAASRYYVMEAGRITSTGDGGAGALDQVRTAMAI